jgi:hypothetical protein
MTILVAVHGLHHFVNGWCNYHWQWQPSLFRVGCTCCCPIMTISQQSPPLTFMWAITILLLQHMLVFCSSFKLTIPRAFVAKFTGTCQTSQSPESPKYPFAHSKRSLQPDGLSHLIRRVLTLVSETLYSPSSISTMLGPEWFIKPYIKAYNTPSNGYSQVRQSLSILMWSRAHHSSKSLLIPELRLPSILP